jgi:drug/metabolite transporter (DMT)-like permease
VNASRDRLLVAVAYATLCILWSTTWIGIKVGLHGAPPLIGAGVRFLLAGACIAGFHVVRGGSLRIPRELRGFVAAITVTWFAIPYALVYLGETEITSGLTAVLFSTLPLFSVLLADRLLPDEPLSATKLAGVALGIGGLVVVFHGALGLRETTVTAVLAMAGVLVAPAFASFGQVLVKREGGRLPTALVLGWSMAGGGALLLASGLIAGPRYLTLDGRTLGSIAYLALAGSVFGFTLLFWLLSRITATSASLLNLVLPILALLEGWAIYDEELNASVAVGSAIVAAGIGLATLGSARAVRERQAPVEAA